MRASKMRVFSIAQSGAQQLRVRLGIPRTDGTPLVVQDTDERIGNIHGVGGPRVDGRPPHRARRRQIEIGKICFATRPSGRLGHVQLKRGKGTQ